MFFCLSSRCEPGEDEGTASVPLARIYHIALLELESSNYLPSPIASHASYSDLAEPAIT
jgi:hypothetical protein